MPQNDKPKEAFSAIPKQTMEQAFAAADGYFDYLRRTVSSFPSGGTEFGEKLKGYAEKNIASTHEFVRQLSRAKDFQDMLRIQSEFMQSQFSALAEQTKSLGEAATKAAASALKPPSS